MKKWEMIYAVKVKEVEQEDKEVYLLNKYQMLREYKDVFSKDLPILSPK